MSVLQGKIDQKNMLSQEVFSTLSHAKFRVSGRSAAQFFLSHKDAGEEEVYNLGAASVAGMEPTELCPRLGLSLKIGPKTQLQKIPF